MSDTLQDLGTKVLDLSDNPKQQEFLACTKRYQLFSGGFGSGKTSIACLKGVVLSRIFPNNLGVVLRRTYPDLRDTTRKVFLELVPRDSVRGWKESENCLTLKNGSQILFRHFDNTEIKVGANIGWFFIDQAEEAEEQIFKGLMGRLRRPVPRQIGMMAMNPNGEDWQYKLFLKNENPKFQAFHSTTYDNKRHLPPDYIADLVENYSQDWVDRFVLGKWNKMSGLIYHEFAENQHMVDPFDIPTHWVKGRGNDWGVDAPATCSFVTRSPGGIYYVFDEYGDREKTPEEHADAILAKSKSYGPFRASILDASAFAKGSDLKSVADKYTAKKYHCLPATKDLLASILTVKQLLKTGRLFFFRGQTEETVTEVKSWKWGARKIGKEMPARGNDHYIDGMRYVIHWMEKKMLYSPSEVAANYRERESGFLSSVPKATCDPVTGLPG